MYVRIARFEAVEGSAPPIEEVASGCKNVRGAICPYSEA